MKESYRKDLANRSGPESCVRAGDGAGEALTGARAGQPLSCEINVFGAPTLLTEAEGDAVWAVMARPVRAPRSRRP